MTTLFPQFMLSSVLLLGFVVQHLTLVGALSPSSIRWNAPCIEIDNISHSYPVDLWRKLTSSVPRREFALENVSTSFDNTGLWMLLGASSSGKSTILKLINGMETPTSGSLKIYYDDENSGKNTAVPILLDERPVYDNLKQSVGATWTKAWEACQSGKVPTGGTRRLLTMVLGELESVFDLSVDQTVGSLSPSELYKCRLAEATIQSVGPTSLQMEDCITISAPILLLDEWMDKETSIVVRKVQSSLERIIKDWGAIVITVTHKPNLYNVGKESRSNVHKMTLSRGRILSSIPYK